MSRKVVATPLFVRHLSEFLNHNAEMGAVRLIERLQDSYKKMIKNVEQFEELAPARRRTVGHKTITVREYVLNAGARDFLVLYWVPPEKAEPVQLLNIRIGGQNRFIWK